MLAGMRVEIKKLNLQKQDGTMVQLKESIGKVNSTKWKGGHVSLVFSFI